jgi:hypothetical protein
MDTPTQNSVLDEPRDCAVTDPFPYSHAAWPIAQVLIARHAIANGARVRLEALGSVCSHCGGARGEHAECMSFISGRELWPVVVCDQCREWLRHDFSRARDLERNILARFAGAMGAASNGRVN